MTDQSSSPPLLGRWHVYVFTLLYIAFLNALPSGSLNTMALWLKSLGYSVGKVNTIPTAQNGVQVVAEFSLGIASDYFGNRFIPLSIATFGGFLSTIILAIWTVPIAAKWFAYLTLKTQVPFSPLLFTWINEILGSDAEERAVVIGIVQAVGNAFNAWIPIFTYPAKQAPEFRRGFIFSTIMYGAVMFPFIFVAAKLVRRDQARQALFRGV